MTSKSENLSIRLQTDVREEVDRLARVNRRSRNFIINEAVSRYVTQQAEFVADITAASAQADKGVFVSGEVVTDWFMALGTEQEKPFPAADVILRRE
jgi:predicted transcriptional regulator